MFPVADLFFLNRFQREKNDDERWDPQFGESKPAQETEPLALKPRWRKLLGPAFLLGSCMVDCPVPWLSRKLHTLKNPSL